MTQNNIRAFNNQTYTVAEGAAIISELNQRTQHSEEGYNSIADLGGKVKDLVEFINNSSVLIADLNFELKKNIPAGNVNLGTLESGDILWGFLADGSYVGMKYLGGNPTLFNDENVYTIFTGI